MWEWREEGFEGTHVGEMEGGDLEGSEWGAAGFSHREKNPRFRQKINSARLHSTSAEPSRQRRPPKNKLDF